MKKLSFSLIIASLISGVSQVKAMNSLNDNTIEAYTREGLTWLAKKIFSKPKNFSQFQYYECSALPNQIDINSRVKSTFYNPNYKVIGWQMQQTPDEVEPVKQGYVIALLGIHNDQFGWHIFGGPRNAQQPQRYARDYDRVILDYTNDKMPWISSHSTNLQHKVIKTTDSTGRTIYTVKTPNTLDTFKLEAEIVSTAETALRTVEQRLINQ